MKGKSRAQQKMQISVFILWLSLKKETFQKCGLNFFVLYYYLRLSLDLKKKTMKKFVPR